jgi:phenylpropionate dioxygenase-like ring-hydroxylating dioxygenase large terminal subunit
MSFIRNRWYVATWDGEVANAPISRKICGEPIVLYRKPDSSVAALPDACPHRFLPLSMGVREGESIRCKCHGLVVTPEGKPCEVALTHDRVTEKLTTPVYPVTEGHRFVWAWIGEADMADTDLVPDFWPCSAPGRVFDGGHMRVDCDHRLFIDNLMDLPHETYVHSGSIGRKALMEAPLATRVDGNEVFLSRWMPDIDPPPFWRDALKKNGKVARWQICHFIEPCSVLIDIDDSPIEASDTLEIHDDGVRGFVVDYMMPETETSFHYSLGMAHNFDIHDAGVAAGIKSGLDSIFNEDIEVLERQHRSIAENPDLKLRGLSINSGGAHALKILERLTANG